MCNTELLPAPSTHMCEASRNLYPCAPQIRSYRSYRFYFAFGFSISIATNVAKKGGTVDYGLTVFGVLDCLVEQRQRFIYLRFG